MKTRSTGEAMDLLKERRAQQLAVGRFVMFQLIRKHGKTHSREVRGEMLRRGLLDLTIKDHWLGALCNDRCFEWTGEEVRPPLPSDTAIHSQHKIKVWRARGMGNGGVDLYRAQEQFQQRSIATAVRRLMRYVSIIEDAGGDGWFGLIAIKDVDPGDEWYALARDLLHINTETEAEARAAARDIITRFVEDSYFSGI